MDDHAARAASCALLLVSAGILFAGCEPNPTPTPRPEESWLASPAAHPAVTEGIAALEGSMTREDIDYLLHLDWAAFPDGDTMFADPVVWRFLQALAPVYDRHWQGDAVARNGWVRELLDPVAYAADCEAMRLARDRARARLLSALGRVGAGTTLVTVGACATGLGCTALLVAGGLVVLDAAVDLGVGELISAIEIFDAACANEPSEDCGARMLSFLTCPDGRRGCGTSCETPDAGLDAGVSADASADPCEWRTCAGNTAGCGCEPLPCQGHTYEVTCPGGSCQCLVDGAPVAELARTIDCSRSDELFALRDACLAQSP